jgi:N-acetylmuramoyl-L-alanine amidase
MAWRFSRYARHFLLANAILVSGNRGLEQANGAGNAAAQKFVVVLDAAHGGDDSGGQVGAANGGTAVAEKTVTLALSVRLRSLLAARGITVVTTREGNVNIASDARAQIANRATANPGGGAACFSLHASESGSGVHIFVSSLAPGSTTRFLPWKTAQSAFVNRSLKLAGTVNSALEHTTIAGGGTAGGAAGSDSGPIPATLGRATLPGVDSMTCPAVAIEMAPIRGADRKAVTDVTDPDYQTQLVESLAAAILEWKTDLETESPRAGGSQP